MRSWCGKSAGTTTPITSKAGSSSPTANTTSSSMNCRARKELSRPRHPGIAHATRRRRAAKSSTASNTSCRCSRSTKSRPATIPPRTRNPTATSATARRMKTLWPNCARFDATIRKHLGRDQIQYIIEPKVDGVSIGVHYRHGKLALGVTRGDGAEGDDITANLKTVRGDSAGAESAKIRPRCSKCAAKLTLPSRNSTRSTPSLPPPAKSRFPTPATPPPARSSNSTPKLVAQRPIRAVFYATGAVDGIEFKTHSEMLEALARFGLPTQKLWWVCDGIEEVLKIYRGQGRRALRRGQGFAPAVALRN